MIVNHPAVLKILRVVNLLRVVFLVRRGPLGTVIELTLALLAMEILTLPGLRFWKRAIRNAGNMFGAFPIMSGSSRFFQDFPNWSFSSFLAY